jgi:excinuclease ABC subunit A
MIIRGASENNLKGDDIEIPLGVLVGVCGVSGSGKSTLIVDTLGRALAPKKVTTSVAYTPIDPGKHDAIEGRPEKTAVLDQSKEGIRTPAHALDLLGPLRAIYAESEDAKELGMDAAALTRECSACEGNGRIKIDMGFLPDTYETCETCQGTGYKAEAWQVRVKDRTMPELSTMTLSEIHRLFSDDDTIVRRLAPALQVGLGYLTLLQPSITLSGGETQRLKIAQELSGGTRPGTLYILDEPTVGQSLEDVDRLIDVLHQLVDAGHSVIVVEHHPMVLASCDWLVEMGPKGGPDGGKVIATGTPEELSRMATPTSPYIAQELMEAAKP